MIYYFGKRVGGPYASGEWLWRFGADPRRRTWGLQRFWRLSAGVKIQIERSIVCKFEFFYLFILVGFLLVGPR